MFNHHDTTVAVFAATATGSWQSAVQWHSNGYLSTCPEFRKNKLLRLLLKRTVTWSMVRHVHGYIASFMTRLIHWVHWFFQSDVVKDSSIQGRWSVSQIKFIIQIPDGHMAKIPRCLVLYCCYCLACTMYSHSNCPRPVWFAWYLGVWCHTHRLSEPAPKLEMVPWTLTLSHWLDLDNGVMSSTNSPQYHMFMVGQ